MAAHTSTSSSERGNPPPERAHPPPEKKEEKKGRSTLEESTIFEKVSCNVKTIGILPRRTCVWVDDASVDECYACHVAFNWYYRRHHCRGCGRVFCYQCT